MTDKELLELAAKAAGGLIYNEGQSRWHLPMFLCDDRPIYWNPITDDGDALRLAVKLRMDIVQFSDLVRADAAGYDDCTEAHSTDPYAATRRAIVRAAAEIGRAMP